MPHSDEAERAVISSVLLDNRQWSKATAIVGPADFYNDRHAVLFHACKILMARGSRLDLVTLRDVLEERRELEQAGGPAYIATLVDGTARSCNVEHYARIVKEKSGRRMSVTAAQYVVTAALNGSSPEEFAQTLADARMIFDIEQAEPWIKSTFENINDPDAGKVDYLIEGLIPKGEVTIIGATWKTGKTLVLYHLTLAALAARRVFGRFAIPGPIKVCVFQLEMPEREDTRRLRRLAIGLGMMPEEVNAFALWDEDLTHYNRPLGFTLCTPEGAKAFQETVIASGAQLVIVDSVIAAFAGAEINDNSVVRKLFTEAFAPLTGRGITVVLLHHKRKAPSGQDDEKSSMLGAQAWGAAAGRVFTLDRLPKKGEKAGPDGEPPDATSFCVRLAVSGSWTPEEAGDLVLEINDKGEATTVTALDDVAQATSKKLGKTEKAALALTRLVRERVSIARESAVILVMGQTDICERTVKDGLAYAKERGWIASHATPGGRNNEQTLTPGPEIEGGL